MDPFLSRSVSQLLIVFMLSGVKFLLKQIYSFQKPLANAAKRAVGAQTKHTYPRLGHGSGVGVVSSDLV